MIIGKCVFVLRGYSESYHVQMYSNEINEYIIVAAETHPHVWKRETELLGPGYGLKPIHRCENPG